MKLRRLHSTGTITFLTTLLACAAFLVGAVKVWGVPLEKVLSGLVMVLIMLGGLALLALLLVLVVVLVRRFLRGDKTSSGRGRGASRRGRGD